MGLKPKPFWRNSRPPGVRSIPPAAVRAAPDLPAAAGIAASGQLSPAELQRINGGLSFYFNAGAPALPHLLRRNTAVGR
jgi:hypothetical protein